MPEAVAGILLRPPAKGQLYHRMFPADGVERSDRFVITDAYTGGSDNLKKTFDAAPKHRKAEYNDFCAAELDYARGDDLLQIGQLDLNAAQRYLVESVPRNALGRLAVASFVILVQRLVLPVLHWTDSRRQFGILRPFKR